MRLVVDGFKVDDEVVVDRPSQPELHGEVGRILAFAGTSENPRAVVLIGGSAPLVPCAWLRNLAAVVL